MSDLAAPKEAARFSSRLAFTFAAVGAAVGLGNVWRFPYEAGENGGAAFVLVYLAGVVFIAFPAFVSEMLIGKRGRASPPSALERQAGSGDRGRLWRRIGQAGVLANLAVMSFYSVIGGWTISYAYAVATGLLETLTPASAAAHLESLQLSLPAMLGWQALFILLTLPVVGMGVRGGIERVMRVMTPVMGLLLVGLVIYALTAGAGARALAYLFAPDFAALDAETVLAAIGQALFSVSVGLGGVMTYAAYLPEHTSIPRTAASVVATDTAVALLAGLAVFPIVFAYGLDPAGGPGLVFLSLPLAFAQMSGGVVIGAAFFLFLVLAALTSAVALYEPAVAYLQERGLPRRYGIVAAAAASWLLGLLSVFSFNLWRDWSPTPFAVISEGINILILPLGVLLIAVFAGRVLPAAESRKALGFTAGGLFAIWRIAVRWLLPFVILALLLVNL